MDNPNPLVDDDSLSAEASTPPPALQSFLIPSLPPSAYYIPSFISPAEEALLLEKISSLPPHRWTTLSHRRLLALPSTLSPQFNTLVLPPALPSWLSDPILPRLALLGVFATTPHRQPNHVLVNEYRPGQGIMAHEDGSAYAGVVATVTLGSHGVLDVYAKGERAPCARIVQERGSLLVTSERMYDGFLHGIAERGWDEELREGGVANWGLVGDKVGFEREGGRRERGTRVSLTFRDVLRVKNVGAALSGVLGRGRT